MNETMKNYALALRDIEQAESNLKDLLAQVKQSEEYQAIENFLMIKKQELADLTEVIHMATVDAFKLTGNKKPWEGVGIRETTKYVYEMAGAVQWAKENAPMVVYETVDKKKFEKILSVTPADLLPEYIHVFKEPQPIISSDLSVYLPTPEAVDEP